MLEDVTIGDDAQCSENDPDGNVDFDVRDRSLQDVAKLVHKPKIVRQTTSELPSIPTERSWFLW